MFIKNCRIRGREGIWGIEVENGKFKNISPAGEMIEPKDAINAGGKMLMPPFVEPHIHLDCVLTAGNPRYNMSGTLFEGIQIWSEYRTQKTLNKETIKNNAKKALKMQVGNGVQFIRTHVDITEESLLGLEAMLELKEEMKDTIEIQIVAFPQSGIYSFPNGEDLLKRAIDMGVDAIGGIPHYEYCREYGDKSMELVMDLAVKHDKLVDVHCDEIDDGQSRFLETLATRAYERGIGKRVVASHTVAMHSYNNAYCSKLFNLLKASEINFASCPTESIHLQGRFENFPKIRGITRVKELTEAGMNVAFGQDSIADPWYPMGEGNLLRVLDMGLHTCHIMGYEDICKSLNFISSNGAKNLNIEEHYGIEEGKPANFIILNAENDYEAVRHLSEVMYSVHNGKLIMKRTPSVAEVSI